MKKDSSEKNYVGTNYEGGYNNIVPTLIASFSDSLEYVSHSHWDGTAPSNNVTEYYPNNEPGKKWVKGGDLNYAAKRGNEGFRYEVLSIGEISYIYTYDASLYKKLLPNQTSGAGSSGYIRKDPVTFKY